MADLIQELEEQFQQFEQSIGINDQNFGNKFIFQQLRDNLMKAQVESNEALKKLLDSSHNNLFLDISSKVQADIDGFGKEEQNMLHFYGASLISDACQYLQLPILTCVSAQTIFHRFYTRCSFFKYDIRDIAMGSVFLAGKAQETIKKPRDLAYVFDQIFKIEEGNARPVNILDDKSYKFNQMKTIVQEMEREILKELGFELYQITWNEQPHRLMYFYINLFKPNPGNQSSSFQNLTRIAFNYLNDSYKTNLCTYLPFQMIVACCIYLAFRKTGVEMPRVAWWTIMETSLKNLKLGAGKIQTIYNQFKSLPKFADCLEMLTTHANQKNIRLAYTQKYHELPESQSNSNAGPVNQKLALAEALAKIKNQTSTKPNGTASSSSDKLLSSELLDKKDNQDTDNAGVSSLRDITSNREAKHSKFSQSNKSPSRDDRRKRSRSNSRKKIHKRKSSRSHSKSRDDRNGDRNKDRKDKDKKFSSRRSRSRDRRDRSSSHKDKKRRSRSREHKKQHDKSESRTSATTTQKTDIKSQEKTSSSQSQITIENEQKNGKAQQATTNTNQDVFQVPTNGNKIKSDTPEKEKQKEKRSTSREKKSRKDRESSSSRVKDKDRKDRKKSKSRSRSHHHHNKKQKKHHTSPDDRDSKRRRSKDRKKDHKRSKSNSRDRSSKFTASNNSHHHQTEEQKPKTTPSPPSKMDRFSSMNEKSNDFSSVQAKGAQIESKQHNSESTTASLSQSLNGKEQQNKNSEEIIQRIQDNYKQGIVRSDKPLLQEQDKEDEKRMLEQIKNATKQTKPEPVQIGEQKKLDLLQSIKSKIQNMPKKLEEEPHIQKEQPQQQQQQQQTQQQQQQQQQNSAIQSLTSNKTSKPTLDLNRKIADKLKQLNPIQNQSINQQSKLNESSSDDDDQLSNDNDDHDNENEILMNLRMKREQMKQKTQQGNF